MVRFSCADDGIGVPEGDEGKIFTKYYRSEEAVEHDPSGTGLGLYINKAIIELSGGSIEFENRPGRGMIFSFLLPAASRI
jgi:two-component system sensor histidine kinase SenX3